MCEFSEFTVPVYGSDLTKCYNVGKRKGIEKPKQLTCGCFDCNSSIIFTFASISVNNIEADLTSL